MTALTTMSSTIPAAAPGCSRTFDGGAIGCRGGTSSGYGSGGGTSGAPTPGGGGTSGLPTPTVDLAEASSQDGKACYVIIAMTLVGLTPTQIAGLEVSSALTESSMPACPDQDGGGPVQVAPPRVIAKDFWDTIPLPVPKPTSRPDYAVTGKLTYLSAGDTNDPAPWTRQTPYGLLTITAHGTYYVEWGDGTPTSGPYGNAGGPYPSGDITHTYDNVGTVTIRVVEDWTATWTIGALQGTLGGLHTTGTMADFEVKQIQSVVTGSN
jgi:hypothetical protein